MSNQTSIESFLNEYSRFMSTSNRLMQNMINIIQTQTTMYTQIGGQILRNNQNRQYRFPRNLNYSQNIRPTRPININDDINELNSNSTSNTSTNEETQRTPIISHLDRTRAPTRPPPIPLPTSDALRVHNQRQNNVFENFFSQLSNNVDGEVTLTYLFDSNNIPNHETSETTNRPPSHNTIYNSTRNCKYSEILDENKATECPINHCQFNNDDNVIQIKHCKHIFTPSSILRWFDTSSRCPVCRYDINTYSGESENTTSSNNVLNQNNEPVNNEPVNNNENVNNTLENPLHTLGNSILIDPSNNYLTNNNENINSPWESFIRSINNEVNNVHTSNNNNDDISSPVNLITTLLRNPHIYNNYDGSFNFQYEV